jgi:hypothetical protein
MTVATEQPAAPASAAKKPDGPAWFRVRLTDPVHMGQTLFRSVSESRAKAFIERRFPRGSEAYLETPDGDTFSHEYERTGDKGADADRWAPFDPSEWVRPSQSEPPGQDAWADREG